MGYRWWLDEREPGRPHANDTTAGRVAELSAAYPSVGNFTADMWSDEPMGSLLREFIRADLKDDGVNVHTGGKGRGRLGAVWPDHVTHEQITDGYKRVRDMLFTAAEIIGRQRRGRTG